MEPIPLIISALSNGAAAAAQDTVSKVIKDAYNGLKLLLQRKFAGKPHSEMILAKYEEKPQVWKEQLKQALTEIVTDQDIQIQIVQAAQKLMSLLNLEEAAIDKYNVQIEGNVQNFIQGDSAQVTISFGDQPLKKKGKKTRGDL